MAKSPVPFAYPIFVRNKDPKFKFTAKEIGIIRARNYSYLLPSYHRLRTRMIAWVVSNMSPSNNRQAYASAIDEFIPVS